MIIPLKTFNYLKIGNKNHLALSRGHRLSRLPIGGGSSYPPKIFVFLIAFIFIFIFYI